MIDETATEPAVWDGILIVPSVEDVVKRHSDFSLISAVGSRELCRRWAATYQPHLPFTSIIDPSVIMAPDCVVGSGSLVLPGTVCSTEVSIGSHSQIGIAVCLSHETHVGSFTHLATRVVVSGRARIGDGCQIGAGATLLPDTVVGDGAVVGAGSLVTKSVPAGTTVGGVPARQLRGI
jgi:sugar O-acyltransferase (sialic acid O-acetyltransferase NeuD family)